MIWTLLSIHYLRSPRKHDPIRMYVKSLSLNVIQVFTITEDLKTNPCYQSPPHYDLEGLKKFTNVENINRRMDTLRAHILSIPSDKKVYTTVEVAKSATKEARGKLELHMNQSSCFQINTSRVKSRYKTTTIWFFYLFLFLRNTR